MCGDALQSSSANSLLPRGEARKILGFFDASRRAVTALGIYK